MEMRSDAYAVLRIPDFRWFILGKFLLVLAIMMQGTVVGWQIYALTGDPLSLGLIGLSEILPFFSVALFAGHVADIVPRKKIILWSQSAFLSVSVALWYFTWLGNDFFQTYGTLPIYLTIGLTGFARAFNGPAVTALVTQLVPREWYGRSAAWNSTSWQSAAVLGPALGGLIYGFAGVTVAYGAVIVLTAAALICMALVTNKPLPEKNPHETIKDSLAEGLRFVFGHQIILSAISLDMFAVLFGGVVALLPIFAADVLKTGPEGLGLLRAAPFVGAAAMAVYLAHHPPRQGAGIRLLQCVAGFGLCMILFSLSADFYLSMAILMLGGALDCVSVVIRATIIQLYTPDVMRGRVSSVDSIFIGSSNELGEFESGVAARFMGLIPSVIFGGTMTLLVVAGTAKFAPKLRSLDLSDTQVRS